MFGKNDNKNDEEAEQLIQKFNLKGLPDVDKELIREMAKNKSLVTFSGSAITDFNFKNTLISQNWMIIQKLDEISKKLDK